MKFELDRNGYITKYLVSGRREQEFENEDRDSNQLRYEKHLRSLIADHGPVDRTAPVRIGTESPIGLPWRYYYSNGNIFVDDSCFCLELRRIDLLAATKLVADRELEAEVCIWSYAAVDVWLNGEEAARIERPVYKPVTRKTAVFSLKKGENDLFIRLQTLGVRDTRISFAIQILSNREEIRVQLPDEEGAAPYIRADELSSSAVLDGGRLSFDAPLPEGSRIRYATENQDFRKKEASFVIRDAGGMSEIELEDYASFSIAICLPDGILERSFERMELRRPVYLTGENAGADAKAPEDEAKAPEEGGRGCSAAEKIGSLSRLELERIAQVKSITRGANDGFALYPMLARYALGQRSEEDRKEILVTLKQIGRRMDCADFMTCGLIRLMKAYELDDELKKEIRETMLGFRYWMDEDGFDGMCFWSENHSLMFYETAYFFGREYPDDRFVRSGKTGRELSGKAKERIQEWLGDVCREGYDEFNSGPYTAITFAALLNLIDFAEEELAGPAWKAADIILRTVAAHTFRGVAVSPQGRVYRDVIYPWLQHIQGLVHYVKPDAPWVYNEWLSALATSRYRAPEDILEIMERTGWHSYASSNARIDVYRTKDYILTSVESPRRDGVRRVWENSMDPQEQESFHYTRSLNECFHGTMQFEPGVYGYQQHMWYAALDQDLVVFANHPGQSCEAKSEVRPGYWYGNGIMPALRQEKNMLAALYEIPENHPIRFVHIFWNGKGFDEEIREGSWLFGRKKESFIGIWCSAQPQPHDDMLFGCEQRLYADQVGLVCVCAGLSEEGSFSAFMKRCLSMDISLQAEEHTLSCPEFSLRYEACSNPTQYVE